MEENKKRMCSLWRVSSSSTRLWLLLLLLMTVSALVILVTSKPSNLPFDSNHRPWSWRSAFGSYDTYDYTAANTSGSHDFVHPAPTDVAEGLEQRPTMVVGSKEQEEALSLDYSRRSFQAVPPLAVEVRAAVPLPGENRTEELNITFTNESNVVPPSGPRITRRFTNLKFLETKLQLARSEIKSSQNSTPQHDPDYVPTGPVYWNAPAFHRSYLEMEKQFKVYVYEEGEQPIFHNGPCGSIYSTEGNFIYKLEISPFRTRHPEKAHVFFLPFSVVSIIHFIFDGNGKREKEPMKNIVKDYIHLVASKYPYWNRSRGSDHFMLSCHDWGPKLSKLVPELFKNSIRALCNANTSEGFHPSKDVTIPEINMIGRSMKGLIGGPSPSRRSILAFYAGGVHGPIRPILLEHWENKDPDIQVHRYLPKNVSYQATMRKSRYCLCPSGYEVASPRIVEALYTGCVPVLIKDHYVPPFSDVLNWKVFAVLVPVKDIPNLKKILTGISTRQYLRMQRWGVRMRRHFVVNLPPKRYDVFHMTLHSIWLRRLNINLYGVEDS